MWFAPLVYGATYPPPVITAMGLAVAAMGLALARPGTRWQTGGGVGFGFVVVVDVRIIVDIVEDPTSHNLWPFEIVSALVIGFPPAALGVVLGRWVSQWMPWPAGTGTALIALALVGAFVSARSTAAEMTRLEAIAIRNVAALVTAERRFRAAQPQRGYTCNLGELGEPFSGSVQSHRQSYTLDLVVYRGHGGHRERVSILPDVHGRAGPSRLIRSDGTVACRTRRYAATGHLLCGGRRHHPLN